MCTVTFAPQQTGYYLAMNRDEQRTRVQGRPPEVRIVGGQKILCPSEPQGGAWIAVNDLGITLALINWYSAGTRGNRNTVSRGAVILQLCTARSPEAIQAELVKVPLSRMNPFRLIGVFPDSRTLIEWRWDLNRLAMVAHSWELQQWASSGWNEALAQKARHRIFQQAQRENGTGSLPWIRRLHRCHAPQAGPLSICMHRQEAATVSYTEVCLEEDRARMGYVDGPPCECHPLITMEIQLAEVGPVRA